MFHSPYLEVSRTIWKTRKAGAEILVEAEVDRVALPRGTMGVQRPFLGGQVESEEVITNAFRRKGGGGTGEVALLSKLDTSQVSYSTEWILLVSQKWLYICFIGEVEES